MTFVACHFQSDTSYTDRNTHDTDDWLAVLPSFFGLPAVNPALSTYTPYDRNVASTQAWQQEFRLGSDDSARASTGSSGPTTVMLWGG